MILFISGELILFIIILLIAGISWIIENLLWIILVVVLVNIVIPLVVYKFPEFSLLAFVAFVVVGLLMCLCYFANEQVKTNNQEVTLYMATDVCTFLDESHKTIVIPEGAIIAIFAHPERQSNEPRYVGSSKMCYWYYEGNEYSSTVSNLAEIYKWDEVDWNRKKIGTTTYRKIKQGQWWICD